MNTLHELILKQAQQRPQDIFLRFDDQAIRFGELRARVAAAAATLRDGGIRADDRVMLMMTNHPDHIVIYLALGWIGAVTVELSIHLKRAGLALQLEDADPMAVIVDSDFTGEMRDALATLKGRPIRAFVRSPDAVGDFRPLAIGADPARQLDPPSFTLDRIQTISYTSGTTGRPKGVVMTDRYFQTGAKNAALLADIRPGDVLFLWEPFYHFAAWMTVLISLQHGVSIAMVERFSASKFLDQVRRFGATHFHYLGGAMNIMLRQPARADDHDNPLRVAWGAAAPAHSWREFETRFGVVVREGYGISEAQNFTHLNLDGRVGSVGKPVAEFESWIEGSDGARLPPRKSGEIVLRALAHGVTMSGYFRNDAATAETLRDGRVYSGDLGYQDEDGFFYYVGRKKDSLRRRGENVSAWEIERVVNAHPCVEESAVVGVAASIGEQDIRVFVKLAPGQRLDPLELIRWCERDLAYYQIPRFVDFVEEFPRGPTHRIRKNDLPITEPSGWDLETSGHKVRR